MACKTSEKNGLPAVVLVERVEITIMASKPEEVSARANLLVDTVILQWPVTLFRALPGEILVCLFSTRDTVDFDTPATLAIS